MKIDIYNQAGKVVDAFDAPDAMFAVEANEALVHQAVVRQQNNARRTWAHTKDRSDVRGGGKKPWRQKGTGRARHGSSRSPIWVGGGITFGPRNERVFSLKMNKRARRKALLMTLSDKVANKGLLMIDTLALEAPKTNIVSKLLSALPLIGKRTLIVVDPANTDLRRAAQNIPFVETIAPNSLNVVDVMKASTILVGKDEMETVIKHYGA